jgi:hypothetical protein
MPKFRAWPYASQSTLKTQEHPNKGEMPKILHGWLYNLYHGTNNPLMKYRLVFIRVEQT